MKLLGCLKKSIRFLFILWAAALIILASAFSAAALSRGEGGLVRIKTQSGKPVELYKDSYALLIGVSDYKYWPDLDSVPGELAEVGETLKSQGFKVKTVLNPDSLELREAFRDFIGNYGYSRDNRLLFFFSGHGATRTEGSVGAMGYLAPADAPLLRKDPVGFKRQAVSMSQVLTWCREMEAKHVLFLFDSCFSGSIFESKSVETTPPHITDYTAKPVRYFITAGGPDEKVPAKSTFTPSFVRGLRGEADINRDGYITSTELGMYLHDKVLYYRTGQTPQHGKIRDPMLDAGEFVFVLPKDQPADLSLPEPPKMEELNLDKYKKKAELRKRWGQIQVEMGRLYGQIERLEQDSGLTCADKISLWKDFERVYGKKDNPFSDQDNNMLKHAKLRMKELSRSCKTPEKNKPEAEKTQVSESRDDQPKIWLSSKSYGNNQSIVVHFKNFPGNKKDWITIAPPDKSDRKFDKWAFLGARKSGSHTFEPMPPGKYEVRAYLDWPKGSYKVVARASFESRDAASSPAVTTSKKAYAINEEIVIQFNNFPGNTKDWIALASVKISDKRYNLFKFLKGEKNGKATFKGNLPPGQYQARAYLNWPKGSYNVVARADFRVKDSESTPRVWPSQSTYYSDQNITVNFKGFPGNQKDWISLASVKMSTKAYNQYKYTSGRKQGSFSFKPMKPGDYEIRAYLNWPKGSYKVVARSQFKVLAPGQPQVKKQKKNQKAADNETQPRLRTIRSVYSRNQKITIRYSGFPGNQKDWISVAAQNLPDNRYNYFTYLSGRKTGTYTFPALPPGKYQVRAYINWPTGGYRVVTRHTFEVSQ